MKRRGVLIGALVALCAAWVATGGPATAAEEATCTFEFESDIAPGLSSSPSSGTHDSGGETGKNDCKGTVNGKMATGPGTLGVAGRYGTDGGDTCASGGEGDGTITMTIPTADGPQQISDPFTFTYGALQNGGLITVKFTGKRFSGTSEVRPIKGDCVSAPITRVRVTGEGKLTS